VLGVLLDVLFALFVARAVWKLVQGFMEGYSGQPRQSAPSGSNRQVPSVHMSRDPVCGTYVIPNPALSIKDGSRQVFFCSAACRDKYRAKSA
jgi:YHS domain-containing protein